MTSKKSAPLYLIIIGPSGGGKGTQAELIEKNFGYQHFSMGDILRTEVEKVTFLGKKVDKIIKEGKWVSPELTLSLLQPYLRASLKTGFIIDGFPRMLRQAKMLEEFLSRCGKRLDVVLWLKIRPQVISQRRKRTAQRGERFYKDQERNDETQEAIKERINSYLKTIKPILNFYKERGILEEIDGERSVNDIYRDIVTRLKRYLKHD